MEKLNSPDYITESKQILKEIARLHQPLHVKNHQTLRDTVEHLHHYYKFKSYGRILIFLDEEESKKVQAYIKEMSDETRKGFEFIIVSSTILLSRVKGKHYIKI